LRSPARTPFGAIFQTEVLLNLKRVAPYAMAILFGGNALLWWGWGPAASRGWATNSEFFIVRMLPAFSFMTLPLFTAVIMGDPVIRDFRTGITPLVFSKPVGRANYLLGKFFGNFCVLVCCQLAFPLTLFLLQGFSKSGMIVQPARVVPYFKHFLLLVVVSHLVLAAFYFTVGTLTRNAKIVYGLAVSFYPLYIFYQAVLLKGLPPRWRIALDPLLMNLPDLTARGHSAEWLNQLAFSYDSDVIANRALMIIIAALCLTVLYVRFSMVERFRKYEDHSHITTINLRPERLDAGAESFGFAQTAQVAEIAREKSVAIPLVGTATEGTVASLKQLTSAFGVELRLLSAERILIVLLPLATLLCVAGLAYYEVAPDGTYSAAYAGRTAESLLLFLSAIAVFLTGEAMHRDRELRIEPVIWSVPAPNFVLLLSKFSATLLLSVFLCLLVGLAAIVLQIYQGQTPVEARTYLTIYTVVLLPSMFFLIAAATALNVLLRDKYLAYALSFAVGGGLVYLFNQGYNHWLYNPVLYGLWTPSDFTGAASNLERILIHRIYCLAIAILLLSLAHLFFERKSTGGLRSGRSLSGTGWSILIMFLSTAAAVVTGLMMGR
jgi:ABC-type transport system involved in multi-copper enzyme maturation permease subunit